MMAVFAAFATLFGLVWGSFFNVAIARLPEDRSVVFPRSRCPRCDTAIAPYDLIPVASFVLLRGRCRACAQPIAPTYPLIELLAGLLAWLLFYRLFTSPTDLDLPHLLAFLLYFGLFGLLLVASYVDVRHWIIPDETSLYAVPFVVAGVLLVQWSGYDGWLALDWRSSVLGALVGGSALGTASLVAMWVLGREGLGWGDVKLLAMIGAFVGPVPVMFLVLLPASILGSVASLLHLAWTRRRAYLPFGPSLALAAVIYVLWGDVISRNLLPGVAMWLGLM